MATVDVDVSAKNLMDSKKPGTKNGLSFEPYFCPVDVADPFDTFDRVLCVSGENGVKVGTPTVAGATVEAEVIGVVQGPKLVVQKFRRRKNSRRKTGHRQLYTEIRIDKISI